MFKKAYDHVRDDVQRKDYSLSFPEDEGRTQQNFKAETDINLIIRNYDKTGLITHVNTAVAQYGDYTEVNEYQESLNRVIAAQDAFDALPSDIRKRFRNDPGYFFEFASNPENAQEMVDLGLAEVRQPDPLLQAIGGLTEAVTASQDPSTGGTE